ncbi:MAG: ribosome maturation factor RimM [Rickettsiales bacterium]|jgi:16S rRNA processing protein RimM|nr:ribosome maturation factor RimM [Rickettsiales bacterium]
MLLVGKILSSHGLGGNVKLMSLFGNPGDIFNYRITDKNGKVMKFSKVGATARQDIFLAKFEQINSIEDARKYSNFELFAETSELPAIGEDEVYLEDLVGMSVIGGDKRGVVDSVANYGAGDLLDITWDDGKTESILYSDNFIEYVDKNNRIITINPPNYI